MTAKIPQTPADYDRTRIIERPDGYYWQSTDGGREYGPFPSLFEAVQDMESAELDADLDTEVGEPLEAAEDEIGIADWLDPETGQPAEDSVPRLEDH